MTQWAPQEAVHTPLLWWCLPNVYLLWNDCFIRQPRRSSFKRLLKKRTLRVRVTLVASETKHQAIAIVRLKRHDRHVSRFFNTPIRDRGFKVSVFKAWRRSEYSLACFAYCQEFCLRFWLSGAFNFILPKPFRAESEVCPTSDSDFYLWSDELCFAVDWAASVKYLIMPEVL